MDKNQFRDELANYIPEVKNICDEYSDETLIHPLSFEAIVKPMEEAFENHNYALIQRFSSFIEYAWKNGDEAVQNAIWVTILECVKDIGDEAWRHFLNCISIEFLEDIVGEQNVGMWRYEN